MRAILFSLTLLITVTNAYAETYKNSVGMEFVKVPAGSFTMGTDCGGQEICKDEEPQRQVTLSKDFWIAKTEVTQAQWRAVMGNNPSHFSGSSNPVEKVSWDDAMDYADKLSERENCNYCYRLPTEAEWEYMAKLDGATTRHAVYGGSDNGVNQTAAVCSKRPGQLGLCDVLGNVWEWTADWHCPYKSTPQTDPKGCEVGQDRVFRGVSWLGTAQEVRPGFRLSNTPDNRAYNIGFRLLRTSP